MSITRLISRSTATKCAFTTTVLRNAECAVRIKFHQRSYSITTTIPRSPTTPKRLDTENIQFILDDDVGIIKLNRPDKLNALTPSMGDDMVNLVAALKKEPLRAVVITGEGKAFSAGGDFKFLTDRKTSSPHENTEAMMKFYNLFLCLRTLPVPVLAAMNGHAVGAGFCLALACDIRVAAKNGKYSLNFVKLGLHPGMAATHFLPKLIGYQQAAQLILTGDTIDGAKAAAMGIAAESVETEKVLPRTMEIAAAISAASPTAVQHTLATLRQQHDRDLNIALQREAAGQVVSYASEDYEEGLSAVQEKRSPKFTTLTRSE